ncbi:MAG TPA: D-glucuronyl C5-epimerase family protein [Solirubrobacteraceae bacterium]|jgi:hypothetical protein|nr:D-glucuronyl C5-epimerase family protein [Solirubrobacteraceae bacterium]
MTWRALRRAASVTGLSLMVGTAGAGAAQAAPDAVRAAVDDAQVRGAISTTQADGYRASYAAALSALSPLRGVRRRELRSAVAIVRSIVAHGRLTPSRMGLVFLTLSRNTDWWSRHGPPAAGSAGEPDTHGRRCRPLRSARARTARVTFPGSAIQFEYYPGLGLQLQVNGTFAAANALLRQHTAAALAQAGQILEQMRPLVSTRAGLTTWEYEFPFGGAAPPWTSGLSQATAIEAYVSAAAALKRPDYLPLALGLSRLFSRAAPAGVNLRLARDGNWYLLYSFDRAQRVLNAHLDAVVALFDLAAATRDPAVAYLEREGLRAARRHIAHFDTGRWSRYAEGGSIADLNYHVLNRDLARAVCQRTKETAICRAWHSFTRELQARCPKPRRPTPPPGPGGPPPVRGGPTPVVWPSAS